MPCDSRLMPKPVRWDPLPLTFGIQWITSTAGPQGRGSPFIPPSLLFLSLKYKSEVLEQLEICFANSDYRKVVHTCSMRKQWHIPFDIVITNKGSLALPPYWTPPPSALVVTSLLNRLTMTHHSGDSPLALGPRRLLPKPEWITSASVSDIAVFTRHPGYVAAILWAAIERVSLPLERLSVQVTSVLPLTDELVPGPYARAPCAYVRQVFLAQIDLLEGSLWR